MLMKKRLMAVLLTLSVSLSLLSPAFAADTVSEEEIADVLSALDIMRGNEKGDLMLEKTVTRAEFTKLIVSASPGGDKVGQETSVSPYPDVPHSFWAAPYVEFAVTSGLVNGYLDGTFHPSDPVTLGMGVTIVLRLLGYRDADFSGIWPTGQIKFYKNADLDKGISLAGDAVMSRRDAMHLLYNMLSCKTKAGQIYLQTLGYPVTVSGQVDRVAVLNACMDGPLTAEGNWQEQLGFPLSDARIYKNGTSASPSSLLPYDVLYYSEPMRTVWAYDGKVTGILQSVAPSLSAPSSLTVSGKTYSLGTSAAAYDVSDVGSFRVGDTLTVLLGKDNDAVALRESNVVFGELFGVIKTVGEGSYSNSLGNSRMSPVVSVTATDGNVYTYPVPIKNSFTTGDLVQISNVADSAEVKKISESHCKGAFSADGTRLGSAPTAADIQILDTNGKGDAVSLPLSRLTSVYLSEDDVRWFRTNERGEIDRLILDDKSGDIDSYGIVTSVQEKNMGTVAMVGFYVLNVAGKTIPVQTDTKLFNLSTGPAVIKGALSAPDSIQSLLKVRLSGCNSVTAVTTDGVRMPVSAALTVYERKDNVYTLSHLTRVQEKRILTGYYDKAPEAGGVIRMIVAEES